MARTLTIDSQNVLFQPNWSISDKINNRTTLSITVIDLLLLGEINIGDSITLDDGATNIFTGIVQTKNIYEPFPNELYYSLKCVDNSAIADKILIAEAGSNETAGYIVQNVILSHLASEGVTAGTIETGVTVSKYTFNYKKCSTALEQIRTITGLNWNIDKDKKLNLFSSGSIGSPFILNDTVQHSGFKQSASLNQYRNVQYVRAGKGKTATQTDEKPSPKPDGVSRTFNLKYPIAEKPTITINSVDVSASDVGINALDTGKKWYFTYGTNSIVQDDTETLLTDSDTLEINYIGLYDILVVAENETEITSRATAETGTSGRYEHITEEKSITESEEALEYSNGLLSKYGEVADNITFSTNVSGLKAGQLLPVVKPLYGINDNFLIESVTAKPSTPSEITYTVRALDGASLGGWEEYFKDILEQQKTYVINQNESLIKLRKFKETLGLTETFTSDDSTEIADETLTLTENFATPTQASPESRVGFAIVGYSEIG